MTDLQNTRDDLENAAGPLAECWHKGRLELTLPHGEGLAEAFDGGEVSVELHGLTREEACRVLRVMRLGSAADVHLDRAIAEAAPWPR